MTAPRIGHQWRLAGHTFGHQAHIVRARVRRHLRHGRVAAALRVVWLHGLLQYGCEDCDVCGRSYVLWHADDEVWLAVVGNEWGTLCPNCFDLRAQDVGYESLMWRPVPESWGWPKFNPDDRTVNWPRLSRSAPGPPTDPAKRNAKDVGPGDDVKNNAITGWSAPEPPEASE